jgi:hypothetical protein
VPRTVAEHFPGGDAKLLDAQLATAYVRSPAGDLRGLGALLEHLLRSAAVVGAPTLRDFAAALRGGAFDRADVVLHCLATMIRDA